MNSARIIVVEDEAIVSRELAISLKKSGYEVVATSNSAMDAVAKAELLRPDLILMDIELERAKDGIEAAGAIRQKTAIPIVFLTAYSDEQTLERIKSIYPVWYLLKPVQTRALIATIELALHAAEVERDQL